MSFENVAERMKKARKPTRGERLYQIWHGEPPPIAPSPALEAVAPAKRTWALAGAYALLLAAVVVALAGTLALVLFYSRTSRWEHRGFVFVVGLGVYLGVQSARIFERVAKTGRLPAARLER